MSLFTMEGSQDRSSQDRNLEAETHAEAMEGVASCLPSHGLLRQLSYSTQDHQPRDIPTHNGQGSP